MAKPLSEHQQKVLGFARLTHDAILILLTTSIMVFNFGCTKSRLQRQDADLTNGRLKNCPHFDRQTGGQAPETIEFGLGQKSLKGHLLGCGNSGVAYAFDEPDHPRRVLKVFYSDLTSAVIYPEIALFVEKKRDIAALSPTFAKALVPTSKAKIAYKCRMFNALIKDFKGGATLNQAPSRLVDEFFSAYADLHEKSLTLRAGKFFVQDLSIDNVHYEQGQLWIIDGVVGGVPPGLKMTFESICRRQPWCNDRLQKATKSARMEGAW